MMDIGLFELMQVLKGFSLFKLTDENHKAGIVVDCADCGVFCIDLLTFMSGIY